MNAKFILLGFGVGLAVGALAGAVWQYRTNDRPTAKPLSARSTPRTGDQPTGPVSDFGRSQLEREVQTLREQLAESDRKLTEEQALSRTLAAAAKPAFAPTKVSPRAASSTVRSAIDGGDPEALLETITIAFAGRQMLDEAFARLPDEQRTKYASADALMAELLCATTPGAPIAAQLVSEELTGAKSSAADPNDDPAYRTLHTKYRDTTGRVRDDYQVFEQTPDGWRWVISQGLVLKRLVETKLMELPASTPK